LLDLQTADEFALAALNDHQNRMLAERLSISRGI
jgi:hypothetical protein